MSATVGDRIREHRNAYGFSEAELAELAGVERNRVREVERGGIPSLRELVAIAQALAVDPRVLSGNADTPEPRRSVARFRAPLGVSHLPPADIRLLARASEVARVCAFLQQQLGLGDSAICTARQVLPVRGNREPWRQGYDLGEKARTTLLPGVDPIGSVQTSLESLRVHVAYVEFETPEVESASLYEPGAAPVVLLNSRSERVRRELSRRAILAHELCHLLHDGGERDLLTAISRENDHAPVEARANAFAPSFIAPREHVRVAGTDAKTKVLQLAYGWGFTYEGAIWHAKNLELIAPHEAEALFAQRDFANLIPAFEQRTVRRVPVTLSSETEISPLACGLVSDLVVAAYDKGLISRGRALEILTFQ